MSKHTYEVSVTWTGNQGTGTSSYTAYTRDYAIEASGKPALLGSADPAFRGDPQRWNPEDLLLASLSACHKLWYLHLCAVNKVTVLAYIDQAQGVMVEGDGERKGHFISVVLRPHITVSAGSDVDFAVRLHEQAHHECFIANSVNFPVSCEPVITARG